MTQPDAPTPARRPGPSPWPWMILGCAIIATSAAVRLDQERRFAVAARDAETPPFSMRDLPRQLGENWTMIGDELSLPKETIQIAGCSDYMHRRYADSRTGVTLTVLVAFGPAVRVFPHSPLECFPANGYQHRGGPWWQDIPLGDEAGRSAPFNAVVYGRSAGGIDELRQVYYSFWHDGRWSPGAEQTEHLFQHRPAMFKVQVERPIVPGEIGGTDDPMQGFIAALIPEIERRLGGGDNEGDARAGGVAAD